MIGNIYKIIHNQSNIIYIGSTFDTLRNRWQGHKNKYNNGDNISIYPYFKQYGIENFKIILIKEYEVCDRKHLHMYEQLWINKMKNCINKVKSFQPLIKEEKKITDRIYREANLNKINIKKKQYREDNKKKIKEADKIYYENNKEILNKKMVEYYENNKDKIKENTNKYYHNNKDKINEKNRERIICDCGTNYTYGNKLRHIKTKKHLNFINQ